MFVSRLRERRAKTQKGRRTGLSLVPSVQTSDMKLLCVMLRYFGRLVVTRVSFRRARRAVAVFVGGQARLGTRKCT